MLPTPATLFDLSGKTALVTGASRGIGKAAAEVLAGAGAHVTLVARTSKDIEAVVASYKDNGLPPVPGLNISGVTTPEPICIVVKHSTW